MACPKVSLMSTSIEIQASRQGNQAFYPSVNAAHEFHHSVLHNQLVEARQAALQQNAAQSRKSIARYAATWLRLTPLQLTSADCDLAVYVLQEVD